MQLRVTAGAAAGGGGANNSMAAASAAAGAALPPRQPRPRQPRTGLTRGLAWLMINWSNLSETNPLPGRKKGGRKGGSWGTAATAT